MRIETALKKGSIPLFEKEILLSHLIKKDRSFLLAFSEKKLSAGQQAEFNNLLERREKGEPLAYLLGYQEFYGRKFLVNKDVLIPRADTEILVQDVLEFAKGAKLTVVDVGTGSGCIAVTLKLENPVLEVIGTEISSEAILVAKKNTRLHGLDGKIQFLNSSFLDQVPGKIDIIVANLPYITTKNWEKLPTEIREWEPKVALESGKAKTTLYKDLFREAQKKLNPSGIIFYEIDGRVFKKKFD